jgi:hypothetical protein
MTEVVGEVVGGYPVNLVRGSGNAPADAKRPRGDWFVPVV